MTRSLLARIGIVLLTTTALYGRADDPPYAVVGQVPSVVDSSSLNEFLFDHVGRRLYARVRDGVYWVDPQSSEPKLNGPIPLPKNTAIKLAPELGRLYFSRNEETFGYVNLRTPAPPTILAGKEWRGGQLAYEPTRNEIYTPVHWRGEVMAVRDAETGRLTAEIKLPGYRVRSLEAVPGKIFFSVENKFGLYVIDAATRTVAPWPVNGKLMDAGFEVEPTGKVMIARSEYHLVAIDIPSARVIARLPTAGPAGFAFDPERRLVVVATNQHPDHPRVRLRAYALGASGFTEVAELKNPEEDNGALASMHGGFLQRTHQSWLFWRASPR